MTKISVLIPAYNAEKFIFEAVESVLRQDLRDFEIIIINDASTDKTLAIVEKLAKKDSRIKIISLQRNKGRAGALNAGLKKASGEYIAFLDADDLMYKKRLRKQTGFLDKNKNIAMVYGNMIKFEKDKKEEKYSSVKFNSDPRKIMLKKFKLNLVISDAYKILDEKKYIPSSSVMVRKKVFNNCKLDENLRNSEDFDLWLQIIGRGYKIAKLKIIAFRYRKHAEQKSKNKEKMNIAKEYMIKKLKSGKYFKA